MKTLYQEVAARMRADVLSGALPPGENLESIAALMRRYRTTKPTVQRACFLLEQERLLERQDGVLVVSEDPVFLMQAREAMARRAVRELYAMTRKMGLPDHRTVRIFLEEGGYDDAKG
ncbi:MAG: GntR family transcriptional regulator [Peptoniphilaceae bacterium]|nr:GntR family transcriptional regulator [Peptoniphilaceae bacterium]MDY6085746.1 GntR family transcriptional regulator [Peptoniphilaceae bacterium]